MGASKSTTNEQQTSAIDPQLKEMYLQNYRDAQQVGQGVTDFGPYQGPRVAGPTDAFASAAGTVGGISGALNRDVPSWAAGNTLNRAEGWLNDAANYRPSQVGSYGYDPSQFYMDPASTQAAQQDIYAMDRAGIRDQTNAAVPRSNIRDVNFQQFPRELVRDVNGASVPRELVRDQVYNGVNRGTVRDINADQILPGIKQYESAYTDAVVDQGTKDLDRARQIATMQAGSDAVRTGSFGGGRHGVVEGETNRGFADATARLAAEERAKAFNVAAGLSGQDVGNKLAAAQANQGQDARFADFAHQGGMAAAAGNQQADMAMAQLRQQAGLTAGQSNQAADQAMAQLRQQGLLTAGGANQAADIAAAGQYLQGGQAAQAGNQAMDWQAAQARQQALNQGASSNTDRMMQALMANAGYGQQAGLANQQAAMQGSQFNAGQRTQADVANQQAGFQNISQLLQAIQQGQGLAQQQYQMPMDAASKMFQLDQYSRGLTNEQIQAQMQAWDDARYAGLPGLQLQGGALGMQLPNLGMSSTGSATTKQTQSPMQNLGQLAGLAGMFM